QFNADYDLSALQGADTLAFLSLVNRKLLPMLVSVFGVGEAEKKSGEMRDPRT
ncbi:hypothetical protein E2320_014000, partial [Naja naja]